MAATCPSKKRRLSSVDSVFEASNSKKLQLEKAENQFTAKQLENIDGFILESLREECGFMDTRKSVIEAIFKSGGCEQYLKGTITTFEPSRKNDNAIIRHCAGIHRSISKMPIDNLESNTAYFPFTAPNISAVCDDGKSLETHYVIFVPCLKKGVKHLVIFDPAMNWIDGTGIYTPFVAIETIIPFFEEKGYQCTYAKYTRPLQENERDVFCQSWSLFMLHEYVKNNMDVDVVVDVACDTIRVTTKYRALLDFYRWMLPIVGYASVQQIFAKKHKAAKKVDVVERIKCWTYKNLE
jgi:hypothetical protein